MLIVRAAMGTDAAGIARVHVESWRTTYAGIVPEAFLAGLDEAERTLSWREWLTLDVPVFVAELDGEIVGFAGGGAIREPLLDYDAELFAIYLLKQAQGRGIGMALLRALAGSLRDRGLSRMMAWVLASNTSGEFYAKTGASLISSKEMDIGGAMLPVLAYGWPSLAAIASGSDAEFVT
jgi:GNAT superfamily N-acetyltransferase